MKDKFPNTINQIHIFNASFGTRELAPALLSAINSVYSKPWIVSVVDTMLPDKDNILYIIICPAGLKDSFNLDLLPTYYIAWQLEDMQGRYNNEHYKTILRRALYVWDYSKFNQELLKQRDNIDVIYFPNGYNEYISKDNIVDGSYVYTDKFNDEVKGVDICFLGYCDAYPRRVKLRQQCIDSGLKIWFPSAYDIIGMQNVIQHSKVCINFAAINPFILATVRLNILLSNQACIISEYSCDKFANELYKAGGVIFTDYDNIVNTAKKYLNDFELRKKTAIKSYQWYVNERRWIKIFDFNSHLP